VEFRFVKNYATGYDSAQETTRKRGAYVYPVRKVVFVSSVGYTLHRLSARTYHILPDNHNTRHMLATGVVNFLDRCALGLVLDIAKEPLSFSWISKREPFTLSYIVTSHKELRATQPANSAGP
jgi:hypothetical protein